MMHEISYQELIRWLTEPQTHTCPMCRGEGWLAVQTLPFVYIARECPSCEGRGIISYISTN